MRRIRFIIEISLAYEDLNVGLRRQLVTAAVLVSVLARATEALSSFGEGSAGLS